MAVGRIFFITAVGSHAQFADDRGQYASGWEQLLQARCQDISSGAERLLFSYVAKILVRYFVGEHAAKLLIGGALQESHGHQELAASRIACVDFALVQNAHAHLFQSARAIHCS